MIATEIKLNDGTTLIVTPRRLGGHRLDARVRHSRGATIFQVAVLTEEKARALREALRGPDDLAGRSCDDNGEPLCALAEDRMTTEARGLLQISGHEAGFVPGK